MNTEQKLYFIVALLSVFTLLKISGIKKYSYVGIMSKELFKNQKTCCL